MVNLATKETPDLVILIDCKHGTNVKFASVEEKIAFCKGMNFLYEKLNLSADICVADTQFGVEQHAIDMRDCFALLN